MESKGEGSWFQATDLSGWEFANMSKTSVFRVSGFFIAQGVTVPDIGAGRCLGPEGNGVSLGEGCEGGAGPPGSKEHKQSVLGKGRGNMEKEEEEWASQA